MRKLIPLMLVLIASCGYQKLLVFDGIDQTLHVSDSKFTRSKTDAIDILGIEACQPLCLPENMLVRPATKKDGLLTERGHILYFHHADGPWRRVDFFPYSHSTDDRLYLTAVKNEGDSLITIVTCCDKGRPMIDTIRYRYVHLTPRSSIKIWKKIPTRKATAKVAFMFTSTLILHDVNSLFCCKKSLESVLRNRI